jgi:hypothetical protein
MQFILKLYIEPPPRNCPPKEKAGAETPAFSGGGVEVKNLEYKLQSELNLPRALRAAEVSEVWIAG